MANRELVLISSAPCVLRFAWENYIFLNNLRERGLSDKAQILVFIPQDWLERGPHPMWKQLEKDFPETKIFYYRDKPEYQTSILRLQKIFDYDPLCRVYCLSQHYGAFPELKDKAVLYTDSDILITENFDISPFLDDDVCYISNANSYTNATYFDSKSELENNPDSPIYKQPKWVRPDKYEGYKRRDILNECAKTCGITRKDVEAINDKSGAAQYLLKGVDQFYWNQVFDSCIELRGHIKGINQEYMRGDTPQEKENLGIQSFCSDIWAVVWNLLRRGIQVETPKAFDFAWATDEIEKMQTVGFYHNAGITGDREFKTPSWSGAEIIEAPAFFKGAIYFNAVDNAIHPFHDDYQPLLDEIINNPVSQLYCNGMYAKVVKRIRNKYFLKQQEYEHKTQP